MYYNTNQTPSPPTILQQSMPLFLASTLFDICRCRHSNPSLDSRSFHSDSSKRTVSDKLSALPQSLPGSPRIRHPVQNPGRSLRRSLDASPKQPHDFPTASPPLPATNFFRPSASEGSLGHDSPSSRPRRVSFDSDRSAGTLRSLRQSQSSNSHVIAAMLI